MEGGKEWTGSCLPHNNSPYIFFTYTGKSHTYLGTVI